MLHNRSSIQEVNVIDGSRECDPLSPSLTGLSLPTIQTITVPDYLTKRIDLIAKFTLGNEKYWWLIAQHNNIIDPDTELVTGYQLNIPDLSEYFKYYTDVSTRGI